MKRTIQALFMLLAGAHDLTPMAAAGEASSSQPAEIIYQIPLGTSKDYVLRGCISYDFRTRSFFWSGHLAQAAEPLQAITEVNVGTTNHHYGGRNHATVGALFPIKKKISSQAAQFNAWLKRQGLTTLEKQLLYRGTDRFHEEQPECLTALYDSMDDLLDLLPQCSTASTLQGGRQELVLVGNRALCPDEADEQVCQVYYPAKNTQHANDFDFSIKVNAAYAREETSCVGLIATDFSAPSFFIWANEAGCTPGQPLYLHHLGDLDDPDGSWFQLSHDAEEPAGDAVDINLASKIPEALQAFCENLPTLRARIQASWDELEKFTKGH